MNKPKLDLQVGIPTVITLCQDKPMTGSNNYGNWFLFGVECEGKEYSFFANEDVQKYVTENKLGKGDSITVTKTITKSGKKNQTGYDLALVTRAEPPANGNGHAQGNGNGHTADDYGVMHECLAQGIQLQKDLGSVVDINRIAITLFITRTKAKNGGAWNY